VDAANTLVEAPPVIQSAVLESADRLKRGSTILVAEDEPAVREIVAFSLRDAGHTILEASDGHEALQILFKHSVGGNVDLLLSDVMMPKMTGTELATKAHSLFPKMKILFYTAYPANLPIFEGMAAHAVQYIQKPAFMTDLQRKVQEMLNESAVATANPPATILVIDDEYDMVHAIKCALEPEGYVVLGKTRPKEAVQLYANQWRSISLVLLDYMMPGMCGDVVLEHLRRYNPAVQALLISAHNDLVRDKFRGSGISCLWKPFHLATLSGRVHALVSGVSSPSK
jgi:CheY-like chemotaxis protein